MKYIFMAGAPGSKWSSVVKNIYYSPSVDCSDWTKARTYYHNASGYLEQMHQGSYFDPGMEFDLPPDITTLSKEELERRFDEPFSGNGVRIIKSHIFCHNIGFIRRTWPDAPVILVHRDDDACLDWWVECGHFTITYPSYNKYYKDLRQMAVEIKRQNADMCQHWDDAGFVHDNVELCNRLGIAIPPQPYRQTYVDDDVRVKVY